MVDLVNIPVEKAMMQQSVDPVMPCVLQYQTTKHLKTEDIPAERRFMLQTQVRI